MRHFTVKLVLAHNFVVDIKDEQIGDAKWNNLKLGYSVRGKELHKMMSFIELIILMKDIEDSLNE